MDHIVIKNKPVLKEECGIFFSKFKNKNCYLGFWFQQEWCILLFSKSWECPFSAWWLKTMQCRIWELGKEIPGWACAFWALAVKGILWHCDWLHRDFRTRFCCGIVNLSMRVVLSAQLDRGLHCDLSFMCKTVVTVRWWWAVACVVTGFCICLRLNLNHSADTWAERKMEESIVTVNTVITEYLLY